MSRALNLKRSLELAGLTVTEIAGWTERGRDDLDADGSVHHHTAGPEHGVQPSLGVCINGRAGLAGPLCNVHGPREESLRVNLVAAGRANHAGAGGWLGLDSNRDVFGLEEEHCGYTREALSPLRYDRAVRVHAAFCHAGGFGPEAVCQHYEWAGGRKIDFVRGTEPVEVDPRRFRLDVGHRLAVMRGAVEEPKPPTPEPEEHLVPVILRNADNGSLWSCSSSTWTRRKVTLAQAQLLVFFGAATVSTDKIADAPAELLQMFTPVDQPK